MPCPKFLLIVLMLAVSCQSQQSTTPATKSGCLQNLNGQFVLLTDGGGQIVLKGDHDTMFGYTGKQVKVTGTVKPHKKNAKPAEMHVSEVKKLADACQ